MSNHQPLGAKLASITAIALTVSIQVGCTAKFARKDNVKQVRELTELNYEQVLSNIAMFHTLAGGVPHFSVLSSGTTQIQDSNNASVGLMWSPTTLTGETFGINGTHSSAASWNTVPVTDAGRLSRLACAFRLMTHPQPVCFIPEPCEVAADPYLPPGLQPVACSIYVLPEAVDGGCRECIKELVGVGFLTAPGDDYNDFLEKPGTLRFTDPGAAERYAEELRHEISCKLPSCWYGIDKCKAPRDACYSGSYGRYVAWVDRCHIDALSRATLSILDLAVRNSPPTPTVEFKKYFETEDGLVEVTGSATGSIAAYVKDGERGRLAEDSGDPDVVSQNTKRRLLEQLEAERIKEELGLPMGGGGQGIVPNVGPSFDPADIKNAVKSLREDLKTYSPAPPIGNLPATQSSPLLLAPLPGLIETD